MPGTLINHSNAENVKAARALAPRLARKLEAELKRAAAQKVNTQEIGTNDMPVSTRDNRDQGHESNGNDIAIVDDGSQDHVPSYPLLL